MSIIPLIRIDHWSVRVFDFPRTQLIILMILCLIGWLIYGNTYQYLTIGFILALGITTVYQFIHIYPYTRLAPKEVIKRQSMTPHRSISLLMANVLQTNTKADKLLLLVKEYDPDIVLTLESNAWWENALSDLDKSYPHSVKVPLENLYGMHLFSKLAFQSAEVKYLIDKEIPSIHALVELRSGDIINFYGLHPMPPSPTESETSTDRDAELLMVGRKIKENDETAIVAGDMNDVAWSYTNSLFQRISELLDPRKGRGFFSTFHAKIPFLRWALDHVFVSADFTLISIKRLPGIGSDHFPIFAHFQYHPKAEKMHKAPQADAEDRLLAKEKIAKVVGIDKI